MISSSTSGAGVFCGRYGAIVCMRCFVIVIVIVIVIVGKSNTLIAQKCEQQQAAKPFASA